MTVVYALVALVVLLALFVRRVPRDAHVVDGDTLKVKGRIWRLTGFDAPEWNQPGGSQATTHLKALLARGGMIAVLRGHDPYGRRRATIFSLRGPLSWRMVWAGHAHADTLVGHLIQIPVRIVGRGLWGGETRAIHPTYWRHSQAVAEGHRMPHVRRRPRMRFDVRYSPRDGLQLPGGFRLP